MKNSKAALKRRISYWETTHSELINEKDDLVTENDQLFKDNGILVKRIEDLEKVEKEHIRLNKLARKILNEILKPVSEKEYL